MKRARSLPAGAAGAKPMVAVVGRPNVGKSTLFNKLAGKRLAIVEDVPGVTRDRHYADAWALGKEFVLIDTGGFDPHSDDPMKEGIAHHVELALEECDLVICVFDGATEPLPADREAVDLLRRSGKPALFVANKADSPRRQVESLAHYELGVDLIYPVSALHGHGFGELEEAIARALSSDTPEHEDEHAPERVDPPDLEIPRVAIIGRPNAGKSSLVNRYTSDDRQLVDDRPGTTVDSVDSLVERHGHRLILVDTAGIRRKRSIRKAGVEASSVYHAIRAMERSDVVVLLIDANLGVAEQDAKIAGLALDRGRGLIIALNKIDLLSRRDLEQAKTRAKEILAFAPWAPLVTLSAQTGRGTRSLLDKIAEVVVEHRKRIGTGEVNRFFEEVLERHPPPVYHNRAMRLYYVSQVDTAPPTFMVSTNDPKGIHFSYQRYVVNQIRARFGFEGTPIRVRYRGKRKKE